MECPCGKSTQECPVAMSEWTVRCRDCPATLKPETPPVVELNERDAFIKRAQDESQLARL